MTELSIDPPPIGTPEKPARWAWRGLNWWDYLLAAVLTVFCVFVVQVWQARVDLNLADEGFLWYGMQRVLAGEVPVRDFQAYDPGRYYFLALVARVFQSDGIVTLRYGISIVQGAALFPALLVILRVLPSRWWLPWIAMAVSLWMGPRHKMFDVAATVWMTCLLAQLFARPNRFWHFVCGAAISLMWFVGQNHVLYAGLSTGLVVCAAAWSERTGWREFFRRCGAMAIGVAAGALPGLILLLVIPHYFSAYWANAVVRVFRTGTNIGLAVPWPWTVQAAWNTESGIYLRAIALGFLLIPVMAGLGTLVVLWQSRRRGGVVNPLVAAATATTIGWAYHAFSRADLPHFAQAAFPLALLLVALPMALRGMTRWVAVVPAWGALLVISIFAMARLNPAVVANLYPERNYRWAQVGDESLLIPQKTLDTVQSAQAALQGMKPQQSALIVPYYPGLYAMLRLRCPMWETYPLLVASEGEQSDFVADLENNATDWVLYWPDQVDGRADLGFANTHAIVWQYIQDHFKKVAVKGADAQMQVYRR